jgi:transposase-like protein
MSDLVQALERLGPREARLLLRAAEPGVGLAELAREYGVTEAAMGVLLLRAAQGLTAALEGARPRPWPEAAEAQALAAFVAGEGPAAAALARLRVEREAVGAGRAALAVAEASSRRSQVERWLRWLAILGILGVSAWSLLSSRS